MQDIQSKPAPTIEAAPHRKSRTAVRTDALRLGAGLLLLITLVLVLSRIAPPPIASRFQTFVTIFLGIFIEAAPFLLAGALVSGLLEQFVQRDLLQRITPGQPIAAAMMGALMGFTFPVCECGVVPVTRRLYQKGVSLPVGIAFLLAAPVVNPVVLASTYAAFGWSPILWGRFIVSIAIAFIVGLIFSRARAQDVLLPASQLPQHTHHHHIHDQDPTAPQAPLGARLWRALGIAGDDFMDMGRFLIFGSMLAAGMQTLVPQTTLLALGSGPVLSVIVLMALAFVLSVCSTVDAFLALSFTNSFTGGAILGFLTFGPMVDVKSALMFLSVFRRRTVAYLILLPLLLNLLVAIYVNLNLGW